MQRGGLRRCAFVVGLTVLGAGVAGRSGISPAIAAFSGQAPAAQRTPVFKAGVLMVQVDAVVVDEADRPVTNLARDEFRVLENGVPQRIEQFLAVDLPLETRALPPDMAARPSPDVSTNERMDAGRLLVLVVDDLNTLRERTERVRQAVRRVLERLGADDLVAIVPTSGRREATRDFTRDRASLARAMGQIEARKHRFERERPISLAAADPELDLAKAFGQLDAVQTIRGVARSLATQEARKKAVIYIGEGFDTELWDWRRSQGAFTFEDALRDGCRELITAAHRANAAVYAVDPRGPTRFGEEGAIRHPGPGESPLFIDRARVGREGLEWLAEETGGIVAVNVTDFDAAVDRIVRDVGAYYVLGYYSSDPKADGKFRRITVEVARPGLRVRARKGYFADRSSTIKTTPEDETPGQRVRQALGSLLPATGLTLRIAPSALLSASTGKTEVVVPVSLEYPLEGPSANAGRVEDRVTIALLVLDMNGKVRAKDERAVTTARELSDVVSGRPGVLRTQAVLRAAVAPGRYLVRVAADSRTRALAGSVSAELLVAGASEDELVLGDLVLGTRARPFPGSGFTLLPFTPTAVRVFGPGEDLFAFVRARGARAVPGSVTFTARVESEGGNQVFEETSARGLEHGGAKPGVPAADYQLTLPLRRFAPGRYRLVVEARLDAARPAIERRESSFEVAASPGAHQ